MNTLRKYAAPILVGVLLLLLLLRGLFGVVFLIAAICVPIYIFRARIRIWFGAKAREWASDFKQLTHWLHLAFQRDRDASATAAMAHQQQFLQGRALSPMNLFGLAAIAVIGAIGGLGFEEWRIARIKEQRDAPCSQRELSLNDDANYRTTRAACSALGATLDVAVQWRERAEAIYQQRNIDIENARNEGRAVVAVEVNRRARATETASRQRRRNNEAIVASYGGPPPDLERSVCELAGGLDCGSSAAGDVGGAPAAADLPDPASGAGSADIADAP